MAGKKKEALGGLKPTTGGLKRDDRQIALKTVFEPITIDAKNVVTVICMLQSPEDEVVLKAVASLEVFGEKETENLRALCSHGIIKHLLPLVQSANYLIKRFTHKLIGMLSSLEAFREQMLEIENVLATFVNILEKETDIVVHEFAALTLAEFSSEYETAYNLLRVPNCVNTLFLRITSPDPDVEKNCLDVMNHLLDDVCGVEIFLESPSFDMKSILTLTSSDYPVIQNLALEILKQLTAWCRDPRPVIAFRNDFGIETILDIIETEDWADLHVTALDLLLNVVDCPEISDYILQMGCLQRLIRILDIIEPGPQIERILGVLARMAQTTKGQIALHKADVIKRFCSYLTSNVDGSMESSCLGIANMAQHMPALESIILENPIPPLLEILTSSEKNLRLRNLAAYALSILVADNKRTGELLLNCENYDKLSGLLRDNQTTSVELCKNVIQVYIGMSSVECLRDRVMNCDFVDALLGCIQGDGERVTKDASLQVDVLECLSCYLIECKTQSIFNALGGARKIIGCMKSRYASIREWAGQLVIVASQNKDFVKSFIQNGGLTWLIEQKRTRYSMPTWNSAIEAIFSANLSAKFAYTGHLDFQDITEDGFYVALRPSKNFFLLEDCLKEMICPLCPVYVANFGQSESSASEASELTAPLSTTPDSKTQQAPSEDKENDQNLAKYMKGACRNSGEVYKWTGSLNTYPSVDYDQVRTSHSITLDDFTRFLPDPYMAEYVENLRKIIAREESQYGDVNWFSIHPKLVRKRAQIIAQFVANEMAGMNPNPRSIQQSKEKFINELKFQLGTTILPLGYVRVGDYLERALLFKVLADRTGFPCGLVRGSHGRTWIEIAIPTIHIEPMGTSRERDYHQSLKSKSENSFQQPGCGMMNDYKQSDVTVGDEDFWFSKLKTECFKAFPVHFLKPNAIVDLINEPGRILMINSREADEYCGNFLFF